MTRHEPPHPPCRRGHKRFTKSGTTPLKDPRDIYELVANNAQRRVRACLEAIIPPDVVEDAVLQCRATLSASAEVTPDAIKKLLTAFEKFGVTKEQVEKRIARRIDTMQPAQLVRMRQIYKSMTDSMSKPEDWFEVVETKQESAETLKDKLAKKTAPKPPPELPTEETSQGETSFENTDPPSSVPRNYPAEFAAFTKIGDVNDHKFKLKSERIADADEIELAAAQRIAEIKANRGGGQ